MHDSSKDEQVRKQNRPLELTMLLVEKLRPRGYRFVGLDEVPAVRTILGTDRDSSSSVGWFRSEPARRHGALVSNKDGTR
jgi:hypothetical protein